MRTSRPRPRPRRGTPPAGPAVSRWASAALPATLPAACRGEDSGALDKLHRHLPVGVGSGGATVVGNRGQAVALGLCEADRARHGGAEDERTEVAPHLLLDLLREARPAVDHRQEKAADAEPRVEPPPDQLDRMEKLRQPLERVVL